MFVDRVRELEMLEDRYRSDQAELFVLYGRRRVGKTELLAQLCQDKPHIFFVADYDVEAVLRASLSRAVNAVVLGDAATGGVYQSWDDLFLAVANYAQTEPLLMVLDEFTYLVAAHPPLASILQRLWDSRLRHTRLMLVLCGSYIGMMEEAVLGYRAPLYGRRTGQYLLEPLGFHDAVPFLAAFDPTDQVRAYATLGGTPAYLSRVPATRSIPALIQSEILTRGTFLYDEARFLLQQELREPRNYFAVLEAVAAGRTRLNEIKQATGIDGVASYLGTLQQLQLVERVVPVTETQPHKSRRGLYRLKDHFFRFWFRFVHPNRTTLERGGGQVIWDTRVAPQLDTFTGPVFEQVCEQFIWRAGLAGSLPFTPDRVGGWWQGSEEIDLIALGDDAALVVACKWRSKPIGVDVLQALQRKTATVEGIGSRRVHWGLCSRSGFTNELMSLASEHDNVMLFDLDQIVAAPSYHASDVG